MTATQNSKAATAMKSIFEKKYVAESQAKAAAVKAGMADAKIEKIGGMWQVIKPAVVKVEPKVTNKAPKANAKPAPTVVQKAAPKKGRPISQEAANARKRVIKLFVKMSASNDNEVTVKGVAKALKIQKVTVSNTIRWAEAEGIIKRIGHKLKDGKPGRKEVFYTLQPKVLEKVAAA